MSEGVVGLEWGPVSSRDLVFAVVLEGEWRVVVVWWRRWWCEGFFVVQQRACVCDCTLHPW